MPGAHWLRAPQKHADDEGKAVSFYEADAGVRRIGKYGRNVAARKEGAELDDELSLGDKIGSLVVVGAPGKSPGEVVLHWPDRKILIVGDAVVGDPPGRCKLLPEKVIDDPPRLRESVRALLALDFDTLLVGDGAPILESARERLRELVDSF